MALYPGALTRATRQAGSCRRKGALPPRFCYMAYDVTERRQAAKRLQLQGGDDGRGATAEEIGSSNSLGTIGMRERAGAFGGRVEIGGRPGGGTAVTVHMPLHAATGREGQ